MRRRRGFTLIELCIACGIVGILTAIAVPAWSMLVAKNRQAEAKTNLFQIWSLQRGFYAENAGYGDFIEIGFVPDGNVYGYLIATEGDGYYAGPPGGELNYGGGDDPGPSDGGGGPESTGPSGIETLGSDDEDAPSLGLSPMGPSAMCPSCAPAISGDDDDDGEGKGEGEGGGSAPPGNPHHGTDSFEAIAFGRISTAPPPNDVDVWSMDQQAWIENLNPGY